VVSSTPRPHFTPGKDPVHILEDAGWATGPVRMGGKSRPRRDSILDRPAFSSVAIPTELPGPQYMFYNEVLCYGKSQWYTVKLRRNVSSRAPDYKMRYIPFARLYRKHVSFRQSVKTAGVGGRVVYGVCLWLHNCFDSGFEPRRCYVCLLCVVT